MGRHIGVQFGQIRFNASLSGRFVNLIPIRQLQHGDICGPAHMELDLIRIVAAIAQIQAAAPLGILAADFGHCKDISAIFHLADGRPPFRSLGVELTGVQGNALVLRDAGGIDGDFLIGCSRGAQRLEVAARLAVFLAVRAVAAGLNAVDNRAFSAQFTIVLQQLFGQSQLVSQSGNVEIIELVLGQLLFQSRDLRFRNAGNQLGAQIVGK